MGYIITFLHSQLCVKLPYPTTDLSGQTIIITGANTGLGPEAARHFVRLNATKVILGVRAISKGEAATVSGLSCNHTNNQFSGLTILPSVIENSKRTLVGHSGLDYILLRNRTLLAIQNMTWNGRQGFQSPIEDHLYVPYHTNFQAATMAPPGIVGKTHTERGLTFFGVDQSGHMIPQYAPAAAYRSHELLLGRITSLTSQEPFTPTSDGLEAQPQASEYAVSM